MRRCFELLPEPRDPALVNPIWASVVVDDAGEPTPGTGQAVALFSSLNGCQIFDELHSQGIHTPRLAPRVEAFAKANDLTGLSSREMAAKFLEAKR